jgi:hypothetical protein
MIDCSRSRTLSRKGASSLGSSRKGRSPRTVPAAADGSAAAAAAAAYGADASADTAADAAAAVAAAAAAAGQRRRLAALATAAMPEEDSAAAAADATADAASLGPRTASGSAPEDLASRSGGERPSEESVLAALASRDPERAPPDASDSDSEEGRKESKKHKKERKEKKSKKHKKEKKSKKSKKHKKEKKSKKKRRRERGSGSSSSTSDSDDDGGGSSSKPVQLSAFMAGSKRTADDGERYSSVSGLKISNSYEMSEYDKSQAEKRERKLRKLNGGAEQDDFQHWGGDFKKAKVTDPAALALQQTLRGINKMGKAGAVLDQGLARSLDEKKKASAASRRR